MDNFRITELSVTNVGPFEAAKFVFPPKVNPDKAEIHLITGENGTGKSTLLMMLASIVPGAARIGGRFRYDNADDSNFVVTTSKNESSKVYTVRGNLHTVTVPTISDYLEKMRGFESNVNQPLDFALFAYSGYRRVATHRLSGIQELSNNPLLDALNFDNSSNPQLLIQWVANLKTKEAIALSKNSKTNAEKYRNSISRVEDAISRMIDKKIEFILEDDPLNVVIKLNGQSLEFDLLPDGLKSIISWIADLLMRLDRCKWNAEIDVLKRNFILFLDEIDVHLHPAWQRKILPVINDLFPNAQIFITTHSPFVVGSTDGAWVHKLVQIRNGSAVNQNPVLSEDSKSYSLVLKEFFDIPNYFGLRVEEMLKEFRELRNRIIHSNVINENDRAKLKDVLRYFKEQKSIELDNIIGMEVIQLNRLLKPNDLLND